MAIDIRATVTCSLGTLISGSISDDYIQGTGLIKTRGSCEISDIITPSLGTAVTFTYTKGGVTRTIPRKLRVLSSFADPFRRTTQVELGCKLTYLSDLTESIKWKTFDDPDNSGFTAEDQKVITLPIRANSVALECLAKLGIGGAAGLTNKFSIAEFDFSPGYVQVLSDLLVSESKFGYLNFSEALVVNSLAIGSGSGIVLTAADIIDIGSIGVGQLPAEAVSVSYSTLKLVTPEEITDPAEEEEAIEKLNWEFEELIGAPSFINIQYTLGEDPEIRTRRFNYTPRTTVQTTYDEWDRVVQRTTKTYTIGAELNTQYYKDAASVGNENFGYDWASSEQIIDQTELYTYAVAAGTADEEKPENYDQIIESKSIKTEPKMGALGAAGLSTLLNGNLDFVSGSAVTEIIVSKFETGTKSTVAGGNSLFTSVTKRTTQKTLAYAFTQRGQQDFAERTESNGTQYYDTYLSDALRLVDDGTEINIVTGREAALQSRPSVADRTNAAYANSDSTTTTDQPSGDNGWRTESKADVVFAFGGATAQRRIEFSLPYASDDTFFGMSGGPYTAVPSDVKTKAMLYGRTQNRLLLGNRSGMNIQLVPEKLPDAPFSTIYVQAGGLTAIYKTNGSQWNFDSNGIICSTDALFWGAAGGTGTFWFPVAPGVVALPPEPPIVDGQMNASSVVLPYNETAIYSARLALGVTVTKFEYSLGLLTEVDPFVLTLGVTAYRVKLLASDAATMTLTGQAAVLKRGLRVGAAATSFALSGYGAGSIRNFVIGTNAGTFAATGQPASLAYQRLPLNLAATSFTLTGQDAQFSYTQGGLAGQVGVFTATGQAAGLVRNAILISAAGSITATGQAAGLAAYQSKTAVVYYTGNASTQSVTGTGFTPGFVALKRRNASSTNGWYNSLRGVANYIRAGENFSEQSLTTGLTSYNSDGFSLGSNTFFNASSAPYVALAFPTGGSGVSNTDGSITTTTSAQQDTEFSVFTYTGTGGTSSQTLGHGLSGAPDLVIIKPLASGGVFVGSPLIGTDLYMSLGSTSATPTSSTTHIKAFNSTTVTIGSSLNTSSANYIVFAAKAKSGTTNIDSFTGAGTATHTVTLGYTPKALLLKNISTTTGDWLLCYRPSGGTGYVNTTSWSNGNAELTSTTVQFTSTGFSVDVGGPGNVSGGTTKALYWAMF
jgi:hypothetical protein